MTAPEPEHLVALDESRRLITTLGRAIDKARAGAAGPEGLPDPSLPCFAQMTVATDRQTRDVLLGFCSLIDPELGVTLLDWRTAPLAEIFFTHDEGESYELDVQGRTVTGKVVCKRLFSFTDGALSRLALGDATLVLDGAQWRREAATEVTLTVSEQRSLPRHHIAEDAAGRRVPVVGDLLDAEQRAVLERDPRTPLLILGGAGCGKTTVALHRLARLHHRDRQRYEQKKMVVVVPEPGLMRLTTVILEQLGLRDVGVYTFDAWVARQARRVFTDLPARECEAPPAAVTKLKRHPALRAVLPRAVDKLARELGDRLQRRFPSGPPLPMALLAQGDTPLLARLDEVERHLLRHRPQAQHADVKKAVAGERRQLDRVHDDLLAVFGDRDLLEQAAALSKGELTPRVIATTLEHTRLQFTERAEASLMHVDEERRTAVDGRSLDEGTPFEVAETIDPEDYAVCFELLRLKTGELSTSHGRLFRFSHMVLDEAQDLAPIELSVLGRALLPDASLTVCGDQAQHIDADACFVSWEGALGEMNIRGVEPAHLRTSYRCSAHVMRFAHAVLGPLAPRDMPQATREGAPVVRSLVGTEAHATYVVGRAVSRLLAHDSGLSVGIITHTPEAARRMHAALARVMPARLVLDGNFSFTPGIDVTPVSQVKGLEFDVVVIPDCSPAQYGDDPDSRRKLHVASTRAIEQLWVLSVGRPSPLLA